VLPADIPIGDDSIDVGHEDGEITNVLDRFAINVFGSPVNIAAFGCDGHILEPP
jgi:hypothetical protein